MRFILFKILLELSRPLNVILLLLIWTAFKLHKQQMKAAFRSLVLTLTLLYIFSIPAAQEALLTPLEKRYPAINISETIDSDAIVVLGGTVAPPYPPRRQAEEPKASRLATAARLFLAKKSPLIIVSGGNALPFLTGQNQPESVNMKNYLTTFNIPPERILEENQSRNTEENARNTAQLLSHHNLKKIILVTSAYHMPRAGQWFNKFGVSFVAFPTDYQTGPPLKIHSFLPNSESLAGFTVAIKEYLGLLTLALFH